MGITTKNIKVFQIIDNVSLPLEVEDGEETVYDNTGIDDLIVCNDESCYIKNWSDDGESGDQFAKLSISLAFIELNDSFFRKL